MIVKKLRPKNIRKTGFFSMFAYIKYKFCFVFEKEKKTKKSVTLVTFFALIILYETKLNWYAALSRN